jgi:hypothetical protein
MTNEAPEGLPLPVVESASLAVASPGAGRGYWAGAPSAVKAEDTYFLAYRLRRPVDEGRGYCVVVAASKDGMDFETVKVLDKEAFGADSLERPALVRRPDGGWRMYVSCATRDSKHWWIDALDASEPREFDPARRETVLPGDASTAVKDPVVMLRDDDWLLWASCHPLSDPRATDRMVSRFASSDDGLDWSLGDDVLPDATDTWYRRGTRISSVLPVDGKWVAYYDGRASASENAEERTGVAIGDRPDRFHPLRGGPLAVSPWGSGSLRYITLIRDGRDRYRLYFEASIKDGSHALFTQVWAPPQPAF